jgi:hypothetical protein
MKIIATKFLIIRFGISRSYKKVVDENDWRILKAELISHEWGTIAEVQLNSWIWQIHFPTPQYHDHMQQGYSVKP